MATYKFSEDAQASSFTPEEIQKYYGGLQMHGANARGVADRSKSIGWRPKYSEVSDFTRYIRDETKRVEATFGRKWEGGNQSAAWQK